ncbi:MAG TPA: hypothetical protein DCM07_13650 [Planctomycetaceae bacterium]|nr:hypothetical protein [Gimesia sp.]HAH45869.1 hypothetical protein [Planctomycetaceae bacterium]HBL47152.1 hypothetical protein [Planctomycetaceae bacterium]|tara:strand:+ start:7637 stop:7885 length:249 start_codon:yes stop_codon:yes gene_type:complete
MIYSTAVIFLTLQIPRFINKAYEFRLKFFVRRATGLIWVALASQLYPVFQFDLNSGSIDKYYFPIEARATIAVTEKRFYIHI